MEKQPLQNNLADVLLNQKPYSYLDKWNSVLPIPPVTYFFNFAETTHL